MDKKNKKMFMIVIAVVVIIGLVMFYLNKKTELPAVITETHTGGNPASYGLTPQQNAALATQGRG